MPASAQTSNNTKGVTDLVETIRSEALSPTETQTWRDGFNLWIEARLNSIEGQIDTQKHDLSVSIQRADDKAQLANDALQRLLEAHMAAADGIARERSDSTTTAITKVEQQLVLAHTSAASAVEAVDGRSAMRHEAATRATIAMETKLEDRIKSLQGMVELRSEMNQIAIAKAEQSNDKRLESVNEFRQTLTDQAQSFVTRAVLDSRFTQLSTQISDYDNRNRENVERNMKTVSELGARVSSMEGKIYIGGAGIVVLITVIQLAINLFKVHAG